MYGYQSGEEVTPGHNSRSAKQRSTATVPPLQSSSCNNQARKIHADEQFDGQTRHSSPLHTLCGPFRRTEHPQRTVVERAVDVNVNTAVSDGRPLLLHCFRPAHHPRVQRKGGGGAVTVSKAHHNMAHTQASARHTVHAMHEGLQTTAQLHHRSLTWLQHHRWLPSPQTHQSPSPSHRRWQSSPACGLAASGK